MVTLNRSEWKHGFATCPSCGLPLDERRDLIEYLHSLVCEPVDYAHPATARPSLGASPNSGRVRHSRCGAEFTFYFSDDRPAEYESERGNR